MRVPRLTDSECAVLTLTAEGKSIAEIADATGLLDRTVRFHRDRARVKLRAANVTSAAVRHGERWVRHAEGCPSRKRVPEVRPGQLEAGLV